MTKIQRFIIACLCITGISATFFPPHALFANDSTLAARVSEIMNRPEYMHASFGVEVYSLDKNMVIYSLHGQELFTPGSTTKLLTEGVGLELLGEDYRFHTQIYRTGAISKSGVLKGNLILVASGD